MNRDLMQHLMNSKYSLAQEVVKGTEYEQALINMIDERVRDVESLRAYVQEKDTQIAKLEDELQQTTDEANKFKDEVQRLFLKPEQKLIWNNGSLEIYED